MRTPTSTAPAPVLIATYVDYDDVQRAVDTLSDRGFPVEHASIVWADLRRVERVTGRRTTGRAFLEGAATGAWFGLVFGVLVSLFVELDGASWLAFPLSSAVVGALAVGVFSVLGHWMRRGQRDFSSVGYLDAGHFELWIQADVADKARGLLGVGSVVGSPATAVAVDPLEPAMPADVVPTTPPADGPPAG
jgi:hypothetical protein